MEFIKHSQQPTFRALVHSADGTRIVALTESSVDLYLFANLAVHQVFSFKRVAEAIAISPSGRYVVGVLGTTAFVFDWQTQTLKSVGLASYCDTVVVNDAGEFFVLRQKSIDGTIYKVSDSETTVLNAGPLYGKKAIGSTNPLKVSDANRYGVPGALTTVTDLIIGFHENFVVVADGKVIGPSSTHNFAERIYASYDCGLYIVVRLISKYAAVKKSTMAVSDLPQSDLTPTLVPKSIAVGTSLRAHTGEQLTIVQGAGTLQINGPANWLAKFVVLTINTTTFDVVFVDGSVTVITDILATAVVQLYFGTNAFEFPTEMLAFATVLVTAGEKVLPDTYGFVTTNGLAGSAVPSMVSEEVLAPTEYLYLNRTPFLDARTLLVQGVKVAVTSYVEGS